MNVFPFKVGDVGLRTAKMPAQLVKAAPLRILLPFNDELMLLEGDGAFRLETNFLPQSLRDDRPRQPVHRQAEFMNLTQMNIRADRSRFEARKEFLRLRLDDHATSDRIQCLLSGSPLPAILG